MINRLILLMPFLILPLCAETSLEAFDRQIAGLMDRHHIPGATVAVAREGKLVIARAYGFADRENRVATQPDSLFRIGSISKTLAATAVLKLVEDGRLDLDAKVFAILDHLQPPKGRTVDARLANITVRQLLQHTGGWDRIRSGDPIARSPEAAKALNIPSPVSPANIIRYMMGQPLDFDPGTSLHYSNLGAIILARVIEKITGTPFEHYVQSEILAPAGIHRMRLGRSLPSQRAEGEVKYYDVPGAPPVFTQVRGGDPVVPAPYAHPLETWEACGAWIASAIDLVRLALSLDPQSGRLLLLRPGTIQMMLSDRVPFHQGSTLHAGLGWLIAPSTSGAEVTWFHTGGMAGTAAALVHRPDGIVYAVLFNSGPWSPDFGDMFAAGDAHQAITEAIDSIQDWPTEDLFEMYR